MNTSSDTLSRRLLQGGVLLLLLGLLTGFTLPLMENPRVGLSSHLEGIMNGTFLCVLGLLWNRLRLGIRTQRFAVGLALYGAYTNWAATLAAGFVGAGATMMPIAAGGYMGSQIQEALIAIALISLSLAMLVVGGVVLWGLRGDARQLNEHADHASLESAAASGAL